MYNTAVAAALESACNRRYVLPRKPYCKGDSVSIFTRDWQTSDNEDGTPAWLTEFEFLERYQMHLEFFQPIVNHIKDHRVFAKDEYSRKQSSVRHQLMIFLFYPGQMGSEANNPTSQHFGIGRGTSEVYKCQRIKAIQLLAADVVT